MKRDDKSANDQLEILWDKCIKMLEETAQKRKEIKLRMLDINDVDYYSDLVYVRAKESAICSILNIINDLKGKKNEEKH